MRIEERRIGHDVDFFSQVTDLQRRVDSRRLADEDADAFLPKSNESGQLDRDVVGAYRHLHKRVVARLRRNRFVPSPVVWILGNDACSRHDAAIGIDDGARDGAAVALREGAGGRSDHQRQSRQ